MNRKPGILAFAGSTRTESYNKKLVRIAAAAAEQAGAAVTHLDLRDLKLPMFDEDDEARSGPPAGAVRLKELMKSHDGFLISSPEYNSSVSAVLKNAIDWASRPAPNEAPLAAFNQKVAVLMAASPGQLGGLRGLVHLRAILGNINVIVLPQQYALNRAHEAFDESGRIRDEKTAQTVRGLGTSLVEVLRKLIPG